ncbi:tripartite tricarboxylate transporter substrate binding protein [Hydrogenophaga sp.]|uniref:tripartite tricarboxylate transporter substrate binding protein n=1 Tax=Hydrogenophaga sp. TaxID=1904254 RepID=UPI0027233B93|nr:tripartite tricarboxylate transporter substrate binding protein [Hydrogenophaga sp.]MDO9439061.1 tripartite tricarboxylate transporter substrate binding protein [Hydrogenophaga sp.]
MMNMRNVGKAVRWALGSAVLALTALNAAAQGGAPVKLVVPVGPGTSGDTYARFFANQLSTLLGRTVLVDNKPGADTWIAAQAVLQAPADGDSVLLISPSTMVILPILKPELHYDSLRDIRPLISYARSDVVLVTGVNSRFKTLKDVLDVSRQKPGSVSAANYGLNYKIGLVELADRAKIQWNMVTYKSGGPATTDVMGGHTDVLLMDLGGALPLIRAGKMHALATTGPKRSVDLPDVPTVAESGFPGYSVYLWTGFGVKAQTPDAVAGKLEQALVQIAASKEFRDFNASSGNAIVTGLDGKQVTELVREESKRARRLLELSGDLPAK